MKKFLSFSVFLLILGSVSCAKKKEEITYQQVQATKGDIQLKVLTTGTVQPRNRIQIKAPIPGRADEVLVQEGQYVKKGQILAWMSSNERAALLDAARAQGDAEVKKWEDLYRATPVVAPVNGTIISRNVEPGQTFTSADSILVMSDRLIVKAQVDETDVARVKLKQSAEVILDAYSDVKILGKIDQVAFEAKTVNNVTTYSVDVRPEQVPEFMRSGMTANITFLVEERMGVLTLPTEAIKSRDGKKMVEIPSGKNERKEKEIETGVSDGKKTEVIKGLTEGETVLLASKPDSGADKKDSPFIFNKGRRGSKN